MSGLTTGVATVSTQLTAGTNAYPTNRGSSGDVLTSDGAGTLTWSTPSGGGGGVEAVSNSSSGLTGTLNMDFATAQVYHFTADATGNWTVNFRNDASSTLNSVMTDGSSLTFVLYAKQGGTARYNNGWQIDGSSKTPKWLGGFGTPSGGHTNSVDVYTYTIIKTANNDFTIYANQNFYT